MLERFLSLPKTMLVIVVLTIAILFIVAKDPPRTICQTQIENFKKSQKGWLYKDPNVKTRKEPLMDIMIKTCKKYNNSPGRCYGLFSKTRKFIRDFRLVSHSCRKEFARLSAVKKKLFALYSLMIRLAWGDKPPLAYQDKLNWFSEADMSFFCLIKKQVLFFYGPGTMEQWEKKTFKKLPGAEGLNQLKLRELSIVSENCAHYPLL